jgi:uncharacterized protein YjbI with pentapeptide repeats
MSGANLSYARLKGANLAFADFRGAILAGVDLTDHDLTETDFNGADLTRARFGGRTLVRTKFSNANLGEADFSDLHLYEVHFKEANLNQVLFRSARIECCNFSSATFSVEVLIGASFCGSKSVFTGAIMNDVRVDDLDLSGIDFTGAQMRRVDMSGAIVSGAILAETDLDGVILRDAQRVEVVGLASAHGVDTVCDPMNVLSQVCPTCSGLFTPAQAVLSNDELPSVICRRCSEQARNNQTLAESGYDKPSGPPPTPHRKPTPNLGRRRRG